MIIDKKRISEFFISFIIVAIVISGIISISYADEDDFLKDALYSADFETSEDFGDWDPFGEPVKLEKDSTVSHTGNYSMKATGRSQKFSGPSLDITHIVGRGKSYIMSMYITYDRSEGNDSLQATLKCTYRDGREDYYEPIHTIASEDTSNARWVKMKDTFRIPDDDIESAVIYVETLNLTSDIWIDDFQIAAAESGGSADDVCFVKPYGTTEYTFENNKYTGISKYNAGRHSASDGFERPEIGLSKDIASDGESSLRVSGRTEYYHGMSVDVSTLEREKPYRFSTYLIYTDKAQEHEHFTVYLEYTVNGVLYNSEIIPNQEVGRKTWACLTEVFSVPERAEEAHIIINTVMPDDKKDYTYVSFYVDNLRISDNTDPGTEDMTKSRKTSFIIFVSVIAAVVIFIILFTIRINFIISTKRKEASLDSMTGCYNRNSYEERIELFEKKPESCRNLFFAVCDVNGLKLLNDNFGHQTGDDCIVKCASVLNTVMEKCGGKAYRIGGDEFVCISDKKFRDELNQAIGSEERKPGEYPFSVSVGYASYSPYEDGDIPNIKSIIDRCDKEMYLNKKNKKSQKNK